MQLPLIDDPKLAQTKWKSILDPLLAQPITNNNIVTATIVSGDNVINHKLGRKPQGWFITDINNDVSIYRSQPFNDLTITLHASSGAVINLLVF